MLKFRVEIKETQIDGEFEFMIIDCQTKNRIRGRFAPNLFHAVDELIIQNPMEESQWRIRKLLDVTRNIEYKLDEIAQQMKKENIASSVFLIFSN